MTYNKGRRHIIRPCTATPDHSWFPLPGGWGGRYRCRVCGAFGYKQSAVEKTSRDDTIYTYTCGTKDCQLPAVAREHFRLKNGCFSTRKIWRCGQHRTEEGPLEIVVEEKV